MPAYGYFPQKNKLKDFLLRIIGLPHPGGRLRTNIFLSMFVNKGLTLDAGCGEGAVCRELSKRGYKMVGIDINREGLEYAKDAAKKINTKPVFICGNIEKIPFPENKFDQVVSLDVLEHVNNHMKAIKEIRRVLKKGGTFIASMPTPYYLTKSLLGINFENELKAIGHLRAGYIYKDFKKILEQNGFKVVAHKEYYGFFSRLSNELVYLILGAKRISKARKKMYGFSFLSIITFIMIYSFMKLDFLLPFCKQGLVMVKAIKK
ncbi:MAG: class I SAM-dependent methyltransferase [Nanoarchaeota archaeon]|nr:class I SAM-dependent methyltransferase [DPANN group archaeon]MBL7116643.1 class I SAM-dependent methyltransferase [Nanoarchaeota archaeon]